MFSVTKHSQNDNNLNVNVLLFLFWQIEIDKRYSGKLCGLCGNFDGNPKDLMIEGLIS